MNQDKIDLLLTEPENNTMDNQHKKIKGCRDLNQPEIALMNRIEEHAEVTSELLNDVILIRKNIQTGGVLPPLSEEQFNESMRCLDQAKDYLQTGQMWFVRAIALPDSF